MSDVSNEIRLAGTRFAYRDIMKYQNIIAQIDESNPAWGVPWRILNTNNNKHYDIGNAPDINEAKKIAAKAFEDAKKWEVEEAKREQAKEEAKKRPGSISSWFK